MKIRDVAIILILVGAAIYLVYRSANGSKDDDRDGEKDQASLSSSNPAGDGAGGSDRSGVTRSKRVSQGRSKVITTASGLQYEVLEEGTGEKPGLLSSVKVHYEGMLEDGTVFDSSYDRGQPAVFPLHGVIKGWTEGVQLMKSGAKYRFVIPPDLAYGSGGAGDTIPPEATLTFVIELISIEEVPAEE